MNELEYTFAVARIRALEASLLTDQVIDQLVNSPEKNSAWNFCVNADGVTAETIWMQRRC